MVCPTCFCSTVTDVTDLTGDKVTRERQWDSCFNIDFSYTASGTVRDDRRSRVRELITHKLASWHDQFDVSGCVGCGRCITWCPVGIDLTQEVAAIRSTPNTKRLLPLAQLPTAKACAIPKDTGP
jgi:ferredoxin